MLSSPTRPFVRSMLGEQANSQHRSTPSAVRTEPRCALFGVCGGCQYQHVEYAEQLRMKARHVSELLARTGGLDGAAVRPTIGSPRELGYRSKLTPQ